MQSSGPMPSRSATPGRNTSITASACSREAQRTTSAPSGRLEVEADGALAAVHLVAGGAIVVRGAARPRAVDAQHVGAEVGEEHPAERSRPESGDLEDARPRERTAHLRLRARRQGGRVESTLGDRHEDAVTSATSSPSSRRVTRDERLACLDAVDPSLVADLAVERHRLAVADAERAGEAGTLGHRRRRTEHHVEAGGDDPTVHGTGRSLVDVGVGDERDGVVALADDLQRGANGCDGPRNGWLSHTCDSASTPPRGRRSRGSGCGRPGWCRG